VKISKKLTPYPLNDSFTPEDLEKDLPTAKGNATGLDIIQKEMLRNLSKPNKTFVLKRFKKLTPTSRNNEKCSGHPLQQRDKPAEDPNSYRSVSLTSCLKKNR
jgi:hypothetical protein